LVSLDHDKKSATVPLDHLSTRSLTSVPLDPLSSRSSVPLDLLSSRSLSRDEANAKVRETIAMVDRWYDSDDWKPWTPPTPEEELARLDDPSAPRPEIIANEELYRQRSQIATTALIRASTTSGRDVLDPTPIEMTAVAIAQSIASETTRYTNALHGSIGELRPGADDGSCRGRKSTRRKWLPLHAETQSTVVTAVDNDHAVNLGKLSAYPQLTSGISILQQVKKPGISTIKGPQEWTEIEITVDSGACVTVMPRSLCEGISILQNRLSREGVEYEVANGAHIPNLGERRCEMMTIGSNIAKRIVFQVADVHKPLLSISGCADMGFDCHLNDKGGFLTDKETGEQIPLERRDNLYIMRAWIRQDPGVNVSQPFVGPS
jgi:hypothetical protein